MRTIRIIWKKIRKKLPLKLHTISIQRSSHLHKDWYRDAISLRTVQAGYTHEVIGSVSLTLSGLFCVSILCVCVCVCVSHCFLHWSIPPLVSLLAHTCTYMYTTYIYIWGKLEDAVPSHMKLFHIMCSSVVHVDISPRFSEKAGFYYATTFSNTGLSKWKPLTMLLSVDVDFVVKTVG